MRLLAVPSAKPVGASFVVGTSIFISEEEPAMADDPADLAHSSELLRRMEMVQRQAYPGDVDPSFPPRKNLCEIAALKLDRALEGAEVS